MHLHILIVYLGWCFEIFTLRLEYAIDLFQALWIILILLKIADNKNFCNNPKLELEGSASPDRGFVVPTTETDAAVCTRRFIRSYSVVSRTSFRVVDRPVLQICLQLSTWTCIRDWGEEEADEIREAHRGVSCAAFCKFSVEQFSWVHFLVFRLCKCGRFLILIWTINTWVMVYPDVWS